MGEKGSLKLHPPWRSWLLRILSVYYRRLLFSAGVKWSLKLHFRLRSYLLRILSVFHRRLLFSAGVKWSLKLHFRLRSYLLRILSVFHRRLLFSAGVKCFQKLLPPLRMSLQVPSPNSKRVLPSSSFFAGVKWSLKLHFRLRSYLLRTLSVYYRRFLFFCWGKML